MTSTNQKPQHTAGPWKVRGSRVESKDGALVAGIFDGSLSPEESKQTIEANAALIAGAPETAAERDRLKEELHAEQRIALFYQHKTAEYEKRHAALIVECIALKAKLSEMELRRGEFLEVLNECASVIANQHSLNARIGGVSEMGGHVTAIKARTIIARHKGAA